MRIKNVFLRTAVVVLLTVTALSGCTKQRNMDIPEFCKRFNAEQSAQTLTPEGFFCERADKVREYNCRLQITQNCTALLSLTTDDTATVTAVQLTCIPNDVPYTDADFSALYQTYVTLCSVLTVTTPDEAEETVRTTGILPESLAFSAHGFVGETQKQRYSIFAGEQYLSLFCERI